MGNSLWEVLQVEEDFVKVDGQNGQFKAAMKNLQNPQLNVNKVTQSSFDDLRNNQIYTENCFKEDKQVIQTISKDLSKIDIKYKQADPSLQKLKCKDQYLYSQNTAKHSETAETFSKSNSVSFFMLQSILSEEMFFLIQLYDPRFFKKYMKGQISFTASQKGFYEFYLTKSYGIFFNKNYFYEGNFIKNQSGQVLPQLTGSYITPKGKYIGQYKEGSPNGKGKYYEYFWRQIDYGNDHNQQNQNLFQCKNVMSLNFDKKHSILNTYDGEWRRGNFIKGTIENQSIKYRGDVKNGKPHGLGKLVFKKSSSYYEGYFKQGFFYGQNNIYQTQKYKYIGGFTKGKKNGKGVLYVKQRQSKNKKRQKILSEKYEGIWKNDRLISYQNLSQKKK